MAYPKRGFKLASSKKGCLHTSKKGRSLILILSLALIMPLAIPAKAIPQTTAAKIQRAEELTSQEIRLRKKLEQEGKIFIKHIVVKGANLISSDSINQIISAFQKHWLTPNDIQQIIEQIKQAYQQSGLQGQPAKIEYQLKRNNLKILIQEMTQKATTQKEGTKQ